MVQAGLLLVLMGVMPTRAPGEELDQRVPAKPGGLLQVDLDLGEEMRPGRVSLDVRSHDADEIWAVADLSGLGASSVKFRMEHDEQVVRLYGRAGGLMSWLFGGPGVSVRVWVPRQYALDLRSSAGAIRVEDVRGSVRVRTTDAPIEVRGAEGKLNLKTTRGSVTVNEVRGDVDVRVAEGDVELSWITGRIEARTGEGDIRAEHLSGPTRLRSDDGEIDLRDVRGPAEAKTERGAIFASFAGQPEGSLETRRGSVEVRYPNHVGLRLDARTRRGTVEVGGGVKKPRDEVGVDEFVGAVNGGGSLLRVYTARGTIRVGPR